MKEQTLNATSEGSARQLDRIEFLDGIRGIASVLVVFCHLACVFLPELYFFKQESSPFVKFFLGSPLNILTNGNAPVQFFFVLSGFLIARKMYRSSSKSAVLYSPVKQYKKLVKLVLPAIILSALLMGCGLMPHLEAAKLNSRLVFVLDYNNFTPSVFSAIKDAFFNVFVSLSMYVGPFWTIRYEFDGALLITAIAYFTKDNIKIAKISYVFYGLIFALLCPNLVSFVVGAFVFDCIDRRKTDDTLLGKITDWVLSKKLLLVCMGLVGLYLCCINHSLIGLYSPLKHLHQKVSGNAGIIRALGFGLCLFCIFEFDPLQKILSIKPLKWLGKISAYTYAFHWPLILSLGCGLYILLAKTTLSYGVIVSIISVSVIAVTFLLSFAYVKLLPSITKLEKLIVTKVTGLRNKLSKNNT